jgi:hypothetical protein
MLAEPESKALHGPLNDQQASGNGDPTKHGKESLLLNYHASATITLAKSR